MGYLTTQLVVEQLSCPVCWKPVPDQDRCPTCSRYTVIIDPKPPYLRRAVVGDRAARLWEASLRVAAGQDPASAILEPLGRLEVSLEAAFRDPTMTHEMGNLANQALYALDTMREFVPTRQVALLNRAWVELGPAMSGLRQAYQDRGEAQTSKTQDDRWQANVQATFDITDYVDMFTDPNE